MQRIKFLDGLRGIAILLVVFYHAYARYPDVVPFLTNTYGEFPIFKYGYWGVQLFFLISGFVILMSLDNKKSFFHFIYKRWLRLFPAMIIATILICATAGFLQERPLGQPTIMSILPGLLFIEPEWLGYLFKTEITPLETVFWTLYIEFRFYIIFGALYFLLGKTKAVMGIVFMFIFLMFISDNNFTVRSFYADGLGDVLQVIINTAVQLGIPTFGWFAGGALAYLYFKGKQIKYLFFIIGLFFTMGILLASSSSAEMIVGIIISSMFLIPILIEKARPIFGNKVLCFIGFISYPLYLMHSNAMIALTVKINNYYNDMPILLLPIIPICIMISISYIVAKFMEPKLKVLIQKTIGIVTGKITVDRQKPNDTGIWR